MTGEKLTKRLSVKMNKMVSIQRDTTEVPTTAPATAAAPQSSTEPEQKLPGRAGPQFWY